MEKSEFDKIIKETNELHWDFEEDGVELDDEMAFDIANNIIRENPGLKEYIQKNIGASDYVGWLMQEI